MDLPTLPYDRDDDMMAATLTDGQARLRVGPFDEVAVVIGRGGHQDRELRTANIAADGVPLYKRPGGGCSVVLDPGNIIIALTLPLAGVGAIRSSFDTITAWMISTLTTAGLPGVEQAGVSDLTLTNRKIGGSCIYRTRGLLYYTTTLLWKPNVTLAERYLQHPPREPEYRHGRTHKDFMGKLDSHYLGSICEFCDNVIIVSQQNNPLDNLRLTLC